MPATSRREARVVVFGACVAIAALLWRGIILPIRQSYVSSLASLSQEHELRIREQRLVEAHATMVVRTANLRDSIKSFGGHVLDAKTVNTAAMKLATHLREVGTDNDIRGLRLTDLGGDSITPSIWRVRVQVEMQVEFSQLVEFVGDIQGDSLSMNITDLEVAAPNSTAAGSGHTHAAPDPVLKIRAVITALARIEARSARRAGS
jgi:hypothetical protein